MTADLLDRGVSDRLTDREWEPSSTTTIADAVAVLWTRLKGQQDSRFLFPGGELVITIAGAPPRWVLPTVNAIGKLLDLPQNWDSYGAPPVDPKCVRAALRLVMDVLRDDTPPPSVVPTSRGGIQIEWHTNGIDLEVEFVTPTRLHGIYEDRGNGVSWESDLSFDLKRLTDAITALSRNA